jgi:uncharacterized protein YecT (DUF1311 family)
VIHERFTRLPCPMHPQTTIALEGCQEQAILAGDAAVNARVKVVFRLLPASGRPAFVAGEQAWLRYRTESCNAEVAIYAGGTLQPVEFASCVVGRNKAHVAELDSMEHALRIH